MKLAISGVNSWPRSAKDLQSATAEYRAAQQAIADARAAERAGQERLRQARRVLAESIVADYGRGKRMRDLVAETNLSREWIRTLLRAAGVGPD